MPLLARVPSWIRRPTAGAGWLLLAAFAVEPLAAGPLPGTPLPRPDTLAAATFDSAWMRIRNSHYDTAWVTATWEGVRERLRPRALAAGDQQALRGVLHEMLEATGESHFALIPGEVADALDPGPSRVGQDATQGAPGDAGLEVRVVEGRVVAVRVEPGGPAAAAGVRPGWVLEAVEGRPFDEALEALGRLEGDAESAVGHMRVAAGAAASLRGAAGSPMAMTFRDGADLVQEVQLVLRESPGEVVRMGNLPPLVAHLESHRLEVGSSCVGVIRLGIWMAPLSRPFDQAVHQQRGCTGIVVDLRGNPGGVGGMVMGFAGHFLDEVVTLGTMTSRAGEVRFVANPRRVDPEGNPVEVFAGRLAILVDELSVSTSEIFAAGLQGVGRARVFGSPTPGQALPSALVRLPNGDVLQHAIADFTGPGGVRIEGRGVLPDAPVPLSRQTLLDEGDPVLNAAVQWIATGGQ